MNNEERFEKFYQSLENKLSGAESVEKQMMAEQCLQKLELAQSLDALMAHDDPKLSLELIDDYMAAVSAKGQIDMSIKTDFESYISTKMQQNESVSAESSCWPSFLAGRAGSSMDRAEIIE